MKCFAKWNLKIYWKRGKSSSIRETALRLIVNQLLAVINQLLYVVYLLLRGPNKFTVYYFLILFITLRSSKLALVFLYLFV